MPWYSMASMDGLIAINKFCHELLQDGRESLILFILFVTKSVGEYQLNPEDAVSVDAILERIIVTSRPDFGGKTFDEYLEGFKKEVEVLKKT